MRTLSALAFAGLTVTSLAFAGCSSAEEPDGELGETEEALTGSSNYGYFVVTHRDFRKCISPICGGWWVKRVNQDLTTCADGTKQAECYVESIQLKGIGLSTREEEEVRAAVEGGHGVIKARMYKRRWNGRIIGTVKANEGWVGATGSTVDGSFYRVADNGIRCITTPCPSTTAYTLNSSDEHNLVDVRLDNTEVPADQDTLDRASNAIATEDGLLVAGGIALPKCLPGSNCGPFVTASEFFFKVERTEGRSCGSRSQAGCNSGQFCKWSPGDICGAADAPGKCSYKPEVCTKIYAPVCGCDGQTYGNPCMAASAGMSTVSVGECPAN